MSLSLAGTLAAAKLAKGKKRRGTSAGPGRSGAGLRNPTGPATRRGPKKLAKRAAKLGKRRGM